MDNKKKTNKNKKGKGNIIFSEVNKGKEQNEAVMPMEVFYNRMSIESLEEDVFKDS